MIWPRHLIPFLCSRLTLPLHSCLTVYGRTPLLPAAFSPLLQGLDPLGTLCPCSYSCCSLFYVCSHFHTSLLSPAPPIDLRSPSARNAPRAFWGPSFRQPLCAAAPCSCCSFPSHALCLLLAMPRSPTFTAQLYRQFVPFPHSQAYGRSNVCIPLDDLLLAGVPVHSAAFHAALHIPPRAFFCGMFSR